MDATLGTNDMAELAGMLGQTLRNWVAWGFLVPTSPGPRGRLRGHRYSHQQAVGLLVARRLQQSPRGCNLKYAAEVIQAFADLPEERLLGHLRAGRVYFFGLNEGQLVLLNSCLGLGSLPNVHSLHLLVCKHVAAKKTTATAETEDD